MQQKIIAITGGTGFIGSHLVQRLAQDGWHIRLLCRRFPIHPLWYNSKFEVVIGDLTDHQALHKLIDNSQVVIHAAGLVKAAQADDFYKINSKFTENIANIVLQRAPTSHFIFMSSLAAREGLSIYGRSKKVAEDCLQNKQLNCSVVRAPAVYGEFDREVFPVIKLLKYGLGLAVGNPLARFSLIHAADLSDFICYLSQKKSKSFTIYEPHDGKTTGYSWTEFLEELKQTLGKRYFIRINCNRFILRFYDYLQSIRQILTPNFVNILGHGKVDEILHPNWICDTKSMPNDWHPSLNLNQGLSRTIKGYQMAGWL